MVKSVHLEEAQWNGLNIQDIYNTISPIWLNTLVYLKPVIPLNDVYLSVCSTVYNCAFTAVLAELPSPSNIRINSVNMGLVLEWDPPQNHTEKLTYRSEYKW